MISGVGAYQQQLQIQQPTVPTGREGAASTRDRNNDRDDVTVVSRSRTEATTRSFETERNEDDRKSRQPAAIETSAAKTLESAQRRGSVLDITV